MLTDVFLFTYTSATATYTSRDTLSLRDALTLYKSGPVPPTSARMVRPPPATTAGASATNCLAAAYDASLACGPCRNRSARPCLAHPAKYCTHSSPHAIHRLHAC